MIESRQDVVANGIRHLVHRFSPKSEKKSGEHRLNLRTVVFIHGFLDAGATAELVAFRDTLLKRLLAGPTG